VLERPPIGLDYRVGEVLHSGIGTKHGRPASTKCLPAASSTWHVCDRSKPSRTTQKSCAKSCPPRLEGRPSSRR
jgi:hypothetical protein